MGVLRFVNRQTPYTKQFTFDGKAFDVLYKFLAIPAGGTVYVEMRTGSNVMHGVQRNLVPSGGPTNFLLLENPTIVTPGATPMLTINKNRNLTRASESTFWRGTTGVSGGIVMDQLYFPVGVGSNEPPTYGFVIDQERIYKQNSVYTFAITNNNTGAIDLLYVFSFYETEN